MDVLPGLFDSISHHGPLARCADDARLFLAATQGPDDADIMSIPGPLDLDRPLDRRRAGACGSGCRSTSAASPSTPRSPPP